MAESMYYRLESDQTFDRVVENVEKQTAENQFRVLHVHDVQETLAEKGFERGPLKIIEVCNAGFAHKALGENIDASLFMPCKIVVHAEGAKTFVTLARPMMIAEMLPQTGLIELATEVEATLKKVVQDAVGVTAGKV